jgi:Domain of unknown function (DUF4352)
VVRSAAGALGIIGLFAAIVLGMLATFGFFGPKAPVGASVSAGQEAPTEAANRRAEQAVPVGESVRAGVLFWTVTDAYPKDEVSKYTFPPQTIRGSFVRLNFTVENVSDRPVTLTDETITLYDAAGTEYLPEPDRNSSYVQSTYNILFNELSLLESGESREGKVNFGVLPSAEGFVARLGDSDPTVSEEKYVDLGF